MKYCNGSVKRTILTALIQGRVVTTEEWNFGGATATGTKWLPPENILKNELIRNYEERENKIMLLFHVLHIQILGTSSHSILSRLKRDMF